MKWKIRHVTWKMILKTSCRIIVQSVFLAVAVAFFTDYTSTFTRSVFLLHSQDNDQYWLFTMYCWHLHAHPHSVKINLICGRLSSTWGATEDSRGKVIILECKWKSNEFQASVKCRKIMQGRRTKLLCIFKLPRGYFWPLRFWKTKKIFQLVR